MNADYDAAIADRCRKLHASGVSVAAIARKVGHSCGWVGRRVFRSAASRETTAVVTPQEIAEMRRLQTMGYEPSKIGHRIGRSAATVRKYLGIPKSATGNKPKVWARGWPKIETDAAAAFAGRRYEDYRIRTGQPVNGERMARRLQHVA